MIYLRSSNIGKIVYVPFLHEPFGTFSLPPVDWVIVIVLALTISPVLELAKWIKRRGWFGRLSCDQAGGTHVGN